MLRLCARPASGTRAPLSKTDNASFVKLETLPAQPPLSFRLSKAEGEESAFVLSNEFFRQISLVFSQCLAVRKRNTRADNARSPVCPVLGHDIGTA